MLIPAFIFGLLSSLHCVGMCGPIAFALPVHKGTTKEKWFKIMAYHLGRLCTYMAIGAVFGLLGRAFVLGGLQQTISIFCGVLLILIAVFQKKILNILEHKTSSKVLVYIKQGYQNIAQSSSLVNFFSLGALNGLLPCGTVYIALIGALATQTLFKGTLYMFVFGLGTLPLMLSLMSVQLLSTARFKNIFRKTVPVILLIVGCLFILRGMGLNVAFISPSDLSLKIHLVPIGCH